MEKSEQGPEADPSQRLNERFSPEQRPDFRTDAERDRDRVLYSSQFARLAEITQVISPERGYVFHNRLTHSLKVAQIARRIAQKIRADHDFAQPELADLPDVAEAAALAHDLGHPPFGHVAEVELDKLVRDAGLQDGFEGNAQSFRILTKLAASDAIATLHAGTPEEYEDSVPGLNWTRQCLDAVLKYPWGYKEALQDPKKWGCYESESEIFSWVRLNKPGLRRSLGAEIIDWADDITYAIHDLIDFFRAGSIPLDRMGKMSADRAEFRRFVLQRPKWKEHSSEVDRTLSALTTNFPFNPNNRYRGSSVDHEKLHGFATSLIRSFVEGIRYLPDGSGDSIVEINRESRMQVDLMKEFTWHYIILNPDLALPQAGQRKAIRVVFRKLLLAARKQDWHLFPRMVQDDLNAGALEKVFFGAKLPEVRLVADYVAGMTERELFRVYRTVEGH